jgi:hypothetical protein
MSNRKGPIDPKDAKVYTVDQHPYMISKDWATEVGQKPKYLTSLKAAHASLVSDLQAWHGNAKRLGDTEAMIHIADGIAKVGQIPLEGGNLEVLVDPYTRTYFRAKIVQRQEMS